jgi:hypothetical protein
VGPDEKGAIMQEDRIGAAELIDLDPNELLGFSQVAKVSGTQGNPDALGRLLSKIGENPTLGKLLCKIGETSGN